MSLTLLYNVCLCNYIYLKYKLYTRTTVIFLINLPNDYFKIFVNNKYFSSEYGHI